MKEIIDEILEDFYLDPHEIDAIFGELCATINTIHELPDMNLSAEEMSILIDKLDFNLSFLKQRAENENILLLIDQARRYRNLLTTIRSAIS